MSWCALLLFVLAIVFLIGSIDDLFIDVVHLIFGLYPKKISESEIEDWNLMKEKAIAVMIPAWQEYDVLEAMVHTNLKRIHYKNYHWFIGVYPNDIKTVEIAHKLEALYPEKITVVVNNKNGPTSKAQCLNRILEVMSGMFTDPNMNSKNLAMPHYVAIHDAEDVIHPLSFKAINAQDESLDFIQVPIFSLPVSTKKWVAGTYLDEFADVHLREIPVREKLRMPIPSAGVGTFFSWRIMETLGRRFGHWFDEGNLTEDYEVSMKIARLGGKQKFMLISDPSGDLIATREYFPESFGRSVRQKTRWTTGIGLQTMVKWGTYQSPIRRPDWQTIMARYALWRDRKALWSNPIVYFAWISIFGCAAYTIKNPQWLESIPNKDFLLTLMVLNLGLFFIRIIQRARFTYVLYKFNHSVLSVPRLILGCVINANAALRAIMQFNKAKNERKENNIIWDKTQHFFPTEEILSNKK